MPQRVQGEISMVRTLGQLLHSRTWIALSLACSLFALYEGVEKIVAGDEIEGILDLVVMAVITINLVNRVKIVSDYIDKLLG